MRFPFTRSLPPTGLADPGENDSLRNRECFYWFVGQIFLHEVDPDGAGRAAPGFTLAQRHRMVVVANPHSGKNRGGIADEPGIFEFVGRTRLPRGRPSQFLGLCAGAFLATPWSRSVMR